MFPVGISTVSIGGLAVDQEAGTLFYTDTRIGLIFAVSLSNLSYAYPLNLAPKNIQEFWMPVQIAVDSSSGYEYSCLLSSNVQDGLIGRKLFWTMEPPDKERESNSSIYMSYTGGSNITLLQTNISAPSSIIVNNTMLFWTDMYNHSLHSLMFGVQGSRQVCRDWDCPPLMKIYVVMSPVVLGSCGSVPSHALLSS